ncbi:Superoxide dismutase (Cu-Zn) 1 [Citrus sinensis]|uniref:Superoxide dismutase (Cu-Zn) 1 n=1 Tax=Citrus sinensis TaxID=2711 RepID=A0ACB8KJN7_CITSI|nr:Superoxide dismutase (Cu-Zn) 1 [Citrus sinensis]
MADWVKQLDPNLTVRFGCLAVYASRSRGTTVNATVVLTGVVGRIGTISFTQEGNGTTTVEGNISGVTPGDHALVIHTYGNVNNVWITTGAPFKPAGTKGVIDNITVDVDGTATFKIYEKIPLAGPDSVIGRGLVLHSNPSVIGLDE